MVKSEEEIEWLRIGAALSDAGWNALLNGTRPGLTERDLANLVERAYVGQGGTTLIHYIGVTSMAKPHLCVRRSTPRRARCRRATSCSASCRRTGGTTPARCCALSPSAPIPTPLYRSLHDAAEAAFDAVTGVIRHGTTMEEIVAAAGVIEERGFTVYDDLVHGFGGGYLPPILGSRSRPAGPLPEMTLEENMTVVVQPNVVTPDHKAGVQVGELVRVTRQGFERLHSAPRGFFRAPEHTGRLGFLPDSIV